MSGTAFDFNDFRRPTIEAEFKPYPSVKDGDGVLVEINADLITLELLEDIEKHIKGLAKDATSEAGPFAKDKAEFVSRVSLLMGEPNSDDPDKRLIRSWNVVKNGEPVPVCFDTARAIPLTVLTALYLFVTGAANSPTDSEKKASAAT